MTDDAAETTDQAGGTETQPSGEENARFGGEGRDGEYSPTTREEQERPLPEGAHEGPWQESPKTIDERQLAAEGRPGESPVGTQRAAPESPSDGGMSELDIRRQEAGGPHYEIPPDAPVPGTQIQETEQSGTTEVFPHSTFIAPPETSEGSSEEV